MTRTDLEEIHERRLAEGLMRVQNQMIAERDALRSALEGVKNLAHQGWADPEPRALFERIESTARQALAGQPESPDRQCYHCGKLESLQLNMCGECYAEYADSLD